MPDLTSDQLAIIQEAMDDEGIPGVSAAVVRDGQIVAEGGVGLRDVHQNLPMTADTVIPICSLTKSITGTAIMQQVEAGRLSLDEPVRSYLSWLKIADEETTSKITPRVLLSHRSGMGRTGHQNKMYLDTPPYEDRRDLVSRLGDVTLQTPVLTAWSYCNEGFVTLGHLVETVAETPLEEYFQARIFDVVGMSNTYPGFPQWREAEDSAHLYVKDGDDYKETRLPTIYDIYLSTGGIASTAHDIALYQIASMDYRDSPLLTPGSLDQMHTISMPFGDTGMGYGLGWWSRWADGRRVVHHSGGLPGVATHSIIVPSENAGAVVMTNLNAADAQGIAEALVETVLDGPLYGPDPQAIRTSYRVPEGAYGSYLGTYSTDEGNVDITLDDGQLRAVATSGDVSRELSLVGIAEDLFMANGPESRQYGSLVHFVRDGSGQISSLLIGGNQYVRQA